MQHINYSRQVIERYCDDLGRIMPVASSVSNFAALCGTAQQRYAVAAQAIARAYGRCGIVILHDDPTFDSFLYNLSQLLPSGQHFNFINQRTYDPLYGMDAESIQNLLIPAQHDGITAPEVERIRAGLRVYLEIMRLQFSKNATTFGQFPYNLNLLLQLTQMPLETLVQEVLCALPQSLARSMKDVIHAPGMQQSIYAAVLNFSTLMERYLWTPGQFQHHTQLSIIQSVFNQQVISVRVPASRSELLAFLNAELEVLAQQNTPFLLIADGINLSNCPALQDRFLNDHLQQRYSTGILASEFHSVSDRAEDASRLLSQCHDVFLFNCHSANQALPIVSQLGKYYRTEIERNTHYERQPFHLFRSKGHGRNEKYIEELNVRPEDMMGTPDRALLCGINHTSPVIIRHLRTNGGISHALLLS